MKDILTAKELTLKTKATALAHRTKEEEQTLFNLPAAGRCLAADGTGAASRLHTQAVGYRPPARNTIAARAAMPTAR